jgi:hypothetical protein
MVQSAATRQKSIPPSSPQLELIAWLLAGITSCLALVVWGETLNWDYRNINAYTTFPLFGLIAFSVMWSQYMVGALKTVTHGKKDALARFSLISGSLVTTVVVLHPLILILKLWSDGDGLPPESYIHYVTPGLGWAVILGSVSLVAFLAFELRHRYRDRTWWRFVDYINDAAIVAIYVHAFNLGTHTQFDWFKPVWFFYGATLSVALFYKYWRIIQARNERLFKNDLERYREKSSEKSKAK